MNDDKLDRAIAELGSFGDADGARPAATRARIMMSLHRKRAKRQRRAAVLIPIGLVVAVSTAWGAGMASLAAVLGTADNPLQVFFSGDSEESHPSRAAHGNAQTPREAEPAPVAAPSAAPEAPPSEPPGTPQLSPDETPAPAMVEEPAPAAPRDSSKRRTVASTSDPSVSAGVPRGPRPDEPGFELYRAAHEAHFVRRDPVAALGAWDAYLRAAPGGRFALEARYNRALTLVRLGRNAEARGALTPFAEGRFGGYRQAEARALVDALSE